MIIFGSFFHSHWWSKTSHLFSQFLFGLKPCINVGFHWSYWIMNEPWWFLWRSVGALQAPVLFSLVLLRREFCNHFKAIKAKPSTTVLERPIDLHSKALIEMTLWHPILLMGDFVGWFSRFSFSDSVIFCV